MNARWFFALVLMGTTASAEVRKLTVEDAVKMALEENPRIRAARARSDAAGDTANSARGRYLPAFNISDEWQHYNSPFSIGFPLPPAFAAAVGPLAFSVRDQNTNSLVVAADEPLLGQLHIMQDHLSTLDQASAANQQEKAYEAALREDIQTQYLRLFEARATEDIARTSQTQLKEQLAVANSKLQAGVLTNADVLRVDVAIANARQQEIQAQAQEMVSRAGILSDLYRPATDDSLDFVEPIELENASAPPTLADAVAKADRNRPEISAARYSQSAAGHQSWSKLFHLLPEVDLEGAYLHVTGQEFAQVDAAFVGIKANWNFWLWGADYYQLEGARAQEVAAGYDMENLRSQIGMDLSAKLSLEHAASFAVEVAQTAITSAEEAYRVTDELVKAGSATTTDLLDSQSALTQAKLNLVRARYEQAIARVAVTRAVGG